MQTTKLYVRDATPAPPLSVLAFCGGEVRREGPDMLCVDGWLRVQVAFAPWPIAPWPRPTTSFDTPLVVEIDRPVISASLISSGFPYSRPPDRPLLPRFLSRLHCPLPLLFSSWHHPRPPARRPRPVTTHVASQIEPARAVPQLLSFRDQVDAVVRRMVARSGAGGVGGAWADDSGLAPLVRAAVALFRQKVTVTASRTP